MSELRYSFGRISLALLERCKASHESQGCVCRVETSMVGKYELFTLVSVPPPHTPVKYTPPLERENHAH